MSWLAGFFRTLPEVFQAWWQFGDPSNRGNGWWGLVIAVIWGVIIVSSLAVAYRVREDHEWVSATLGSLGGLGVLWWIFGILPSAWIYFVDSNKEILEDVVIPASLAPNILGTELPIATDLYDVIRDVVVVVWHLVFIGAAFWAALALQNRFPKTLATGEEKSEAGGYK